MKAVYMGAGVALGALSLQVAAQTTVRYIGSDGNWFDAANWSSGRIPGADDDVVIAGRSRVQIDPARGAVTVRIRDLIVRDAALLETLPGTLMQTRDEILVQNGSVVHRASASVGETLIVDGSAQARLACSPAQVVECVLWPWNGFGAGGMLLNPTPKSRRDLVLKTSATVEFGLGGRRPASLSRDAAGTLQVEAGVGHYATLHADTAQIDGRLRLSLFYGFRPAAGDRFRIIDIGRYASGRFTGLPEGSYVGCTEDHVALTISYRGGDGNDIELAASDVAPMVCVLLPAVQTGGSWPPRISDG
ncbi:hypothetical protein [Solimonas flava]|uniref:hypothetical protein n=1 Tax=Solimonas flava TaxID=415849 RepID=UPI0003FFE9E0|nr:hypothetical protein [Solimonas flava]